MKTEKNVEELMEKYRELYLDYKSLYEITRKELLRGEINEFHRKQRCK